MPKALIKAVTKFYAGKKVPSKYRARYGKVYSRTEARSVGYAVARKLRLK